jgi:hypothetical protein
MLPLRRHRKIAWLLPALIAIAGCAGQGSVGDATVQGSVTVDGQLAPRGTVAFHPVEAGPVAIGTIDANGSYALRIGQGNPKDINSSLIRSGEYQVTVVVTAEPDRESRIADDGPPRPGPRLAAAKYANKTTSGLSQTVKKGPNLINFALDGAWADENQTNDETDANDETDTSDEQPQTDEQTETTNEATTPQDPESTQENQAPAESATSGPTQEQESEPSPTSESADVEPTRQATSQEDPS